MIIQLFLLVVAPPAVAIGTFNDLAGSGARFTGFLHPADSHAAEHSVCKVPQKKSRVFVHSMPKTGTTSVGRALKLLGYNDCSTNTMHSKHSFQNILPANKLVNHFPINAVPATVQEQARAMLAQLKQDVDNLTESTYFIGDDESQNKGTCDSYSDFPIGLATYMNLRLKMLLWPNSTYIWIDRPFDDWLESLVNDRSSSRRAKDVRARCSIPMMRKFIDDRRQELVELERWIPGSVIFMNMSSMNWKHLLPGLPVPEDCKPPSQELPHANTADDTKIRHARSLSLFRSNIVFDKPCD